MLLPTRSTTRRVLCRPRFGRSWRGSRVLARVGLALLVLLGVGAWLYIASNIPEWARQRTQVARNAWMNKAVTEANVVEHRWKDLFPPPEPLGEGAELAAFLGKEPLLVGLVRLRPSFQAYQRDGEVLRPATEAQVRTWKSWAEAAQDHTTTYWVPKAPQPGADPWIVVRHGPWFAFKTWVPGSREVEALLGIHLPAPYHLRLGILHESHLGPQRRPRPELRPEPWARWPALQVGPGTMPPRGALGFMGATDVFGKGWNWIGRPDPETEALVNRQIGGSVVLGGTAMGLALVASLLGWYLRHRARLRERLDKDRLAAMTHSLKTPLAVLRTRCDSLRLGRVPPERLEATHDRLYQDVLRLERVVEAGLRLLVREVEGETPQALDEQWVQEVVEELKPAFRGADRELILELAAVEVRAVPSALRAALLVLLENGLLHGEGAVRLQAAAEGACIRFQVRDQGVGLDRRALHSLGRPFLRLRRAGEEGFRNAGHGLGLSLVFQMARQEGWGLVFQSAPGQGFTAEMLVPST